MEFQIALNSKGNMNINQVVAQWDDDARVWVATSDDVPGLVAEAETQEKLIARLCARVPELLALNAHLVVQAAGPHEFNIHWKQNQRVMYA